jgi:hypothetical protein
MNQAKVYSQATSLPKEKPIEDVSLTEVKRQLKYAWLESQVTKDYISKLEQDFVALQTQAMNAACNGNEKIAVTNLIKMKTTQELIDYAKTNS